MKRETFKPDSSLKSPNTSLTNTKCVREVGLNPPKSAKNIDSKVQSLITGFSLPSSLTTKPSEVVRSGALPSDGSKDGKLDVQWLKKDTKDKVPRSSSKKAKNWARTCQENKITK